MSLRYEIGIRLNPNILETNIFSKGIFPQNHYRSATSTIDFSTGMRVPDPYAMSSECTEGYFSNNLIFIRGLTQYAPDFSTRRVDARVGSISPGYVQEFASPLSDKNPNGEIVGIMPNSDQILQITIADLQANEPRTVVCLNRDNPVCRIPADVSYRLETPKGQGSLKFWCAYPDNEPESEFTWRP